MDFQYLGGLETKPIKDAVIQVRQALGHLNIEEVRDVGFCRKR